MPRRGRPLAMYITNKPLTPRPMGSESADVDAAVIASAEAASSCRPQEPEKRSPPPGPTLHIHGPSPSRPSSSNPPSSATGPRPETSPNPRPTSFPISFPPIFLQRSKAPSASLAPSTAEGRPVPITDTTDAHHTSALQKLNSKYPSAVRRHGYAPEAPGAQSSTYSQPVLVRTYSGPSPSQGSRSTRSRQYRPPSSSRGVSRRVPLPSASTPGSGGPGRPIQPTVSGVGVGTTSSIGTGGDKHSTETCNDNAYGVSMPHPYKAKRATNSSSNKLPLPLPWPFQSRQEPEEPKLPPLEAFSFKSFMADLQERGGENDIGADLDRIAEICARSRYSLSNQYEVHVAPHGSGTSFISGPPPSSTPHKKGHNRARSHGHGASGPTLQAITSDDENSARSHPRRRNGGRRRSAAYGTLETIMSSSRSSDEDKSKKKSAAELAEEVRGRAARKAWDTNPSASGSGSASASASAGASTGDSPAGQQAASNKSTADASRLARKKSASFATAIMDSGRSSSGKTKTNTSSSSRKKSAAVATSSALLSEPARPQTSNSHLGVRTAPDTARPAPGVPRAGGRHPGARPFRNEGMSQQGHAAAAAAGGVAAAGSGSWGGWIPWRAGQAAADTQEARRSHAEGSLRQLLRAVGEGQGQGQGERERESARLP